MRLEDIPEIILPRFQANSYSDFDRTFLPHNEIKLKSVNVSNSGDIELIAVPIDGRQEQWKDRIKFKKQDNAKREFLLNWLKNRIGQTIDYILKSEFNFNN